MKQFGIYGSVEALATVLAAEAIVFNNISVSTVSGVPTVSDTPKIATISRSRGGKRNQTTGRIACADILACLERSAIRITFQSFRRCEVGRRIVVFSNPLPNMPRCKFAAEQTCIKQSGKAIMRANCERPGSRAENYQRWDSWDCRDKPYLLGSGVSPTHPSRPAGREAGQVNNAANTRKI